MNNNNNNNNNNNINNNNNNNKLKEIQISEIENQIIYEISYNKCIEILYDCDIEY
jgi:hypothetical protein